MIHVGDCLEIMKTLDAGSIDAIVTDPPYGLSFMGKDWDHGIPGEAFWSEALRVAKPGTHLLAFGGTRTFHRLTVAIEDAGWEIRDCITWVYGSGFPKSHDVSKAIDREAGAERTKLGINPNSRGDNRDSGGWKRPWQADPEAAAKMITAPATPAAQQWQGWGTALKPAWEPIIVSRKPLAGTVAQNVQQYGTGAVNVDGCRVDSGGWYDAPGNRGHENNRSRVMKFGMTAGKSHDAGRWPANLIHDGSDEVTGLFPETTSGLRKASHADNGKDSGTYGKYSGRERSQDYGGDSGSAARFFYCAKASKADRDSGLDGWEETPRNAESVWAGECPDCGCRMMLNGKPTCGHGKVKWVQGLPRRNHHPTVKPNDLMRYLCRLVTPPGGIVLDPFCGSGSTGKAAVMEGFQFIGIELNPEYAAIAEARIQAEIDKTLLLDAVK